MIIKFDSDLHFDPLLCSFSNGTYGLEIIVMNVAGEKLKFRLLERGSHLKCNENCVNCA